MKNLPNPLLPLDVPAAVRLAHGAGPYANTRQALAGLALSRLGGQRVLLKPNAGRIAGAGSGVTTHPQVVAAAIDVCRELGADVAIGESPIVGVDVQEAYRVTGIADVAQARDCPLIDLDVRRYVEVEIPHGRVLQKLRVCADVLEFDFVVSVPVMKTHMHTGVTLAVKNMKGCLWRRSKTELHMLPPVAGADVKSIDVAIADLASVLRPHLAIVDGTVGMEGLGPSAGEPKPLDVVLASADAVATDAVACRLMGIRAQDVPHLRMAAERGYGQIQLDALDISPPQWQEWRSAFARPPENLSIEFPNITVWDNSSCSACQSTLLLFLQRYKDSLFDYFPSQTHVDIAIGKSNPDLPAGTLLIGNCTAHQRDKGVFVPGCPPVGSQIIAALSPPRSDKTKDSTNGEPCTDGG